jgi:predicted site-specific integrase-resolvase
MKLIGVEEAAQKLKITPSLVRRYCRTGRLPAQKVNGWVIALSDLEKFIGQERPVGYPKGKPRKAKVSG